MMTKSDLPEEYETNDGPQDAWEAKLRRCRPRSPSLSWAQISSWIERERKVSSELSWDVKEGRPLRMQPRFWGVVGGSWACGAVVGAAIALVVMGGGAAADATTRPVEASSRYDATTSEHLHARLQPKVKPEVGSPIRAAPRHTLTMPVSQQQVLHHVDAGPLWAGYCLRGSGPRPARAAMEEGGLEEGGLEEGGLEEGEVESLYGASVPAQHDAVRRRQGEPSLPATREQLLRDLLDGSLGA